MGRGKTDEQLKEWGFNPGDLFVGECWGTAKRLQQQTIVLENSSRERLWRLTGNQRDRCVWWKWATDLKVRDCPHSLKGSDQVPLLSKGRDEYSQLTWVKILLFNTSYRLCQAKPCALISSISETYTHTVSAYGCIHIYTIIYLYHIYCYIDYICLFAYKLPIYTYICRSTYIICIHTYKHIYIHHNTYIYTTIKFGCKMCMYIHVCSYKWIFVQIMTW